MTQIKRLTSFVLFSVALMVLAAAAPASAAETRGVVNINSASAEQLQLLPRIGPSVAERILTFRKENGPFKSADDLMMVTGIGDKTFALLKPHVSVSGETTLSEKVRVPRTAAQAGN